MEILIIILILLIVLMYPCFKAASDYDDYSEKVQWMKPGECPITNDEEGENK